MASQAQISPQASAGVSDQSPPSSAPQASHEIQLRYKLAPTTFKTLCTIQKSPSRKEVLKKACFATEFRSFPVKQAERSFLREINDHTAIPYQIGEVVSEPWHKVFLIVQINLSRAGWPSKLSKIARQELHKEVGRIYVVLDRVLRCLVDILGERDDGTGVNTALDVLRSVKAGVWEGSEKQLLQAEGIGLVMMGKLVQAGINTIRQLSKLEFYHIERLLSRNPPFGQKMVRQLAGFPVLTLNMEVIDQYRPQPSQPSQAAKQPSVNPLWVARVVLGFENEAVPTWKKSNPWATFVVEGDDGRLVWFWRGSVKRLMGGKEIIVGLEARKGEVLKTSFACEEIVGTILRETLTI